MKNYGHSAEMNWSAWERSSITGRLFCVAAGDGASADGGTAQSVVRIPAASPIALDCIFPWHKFCWSELWLSLFRTELCWRFKIC